MKRMLSFVLAALLAASALAQPAVNTMTILSGATATGVAAGVPSTFPGVSGTKTYQASGATTAGAGASAILVQCSGNGDNWDTLGTITLTLSTTTSSDSFVSTDRCKFIRANVSSISGTGASVSVTVGY